MNYIIEANIGIAFFYGIYLLVLRNETDFTKQRFFLLGSLLCCLIFPLIQIQSKIDVTSEVTTYVLNDLEVNITPASASWSLREIAFLVYTVIVALLIAPLLLNAFRLYSTISGSSGKRHASFYLI